MFEIFNREDRVTAANHLIISNAFHSSIEFVRYSSTSPEELGPITIITNRAIQEASLLKENARELGREYVINQLGTVPGEGFAREMSTKELAALIILAEVYDQPPPEPVGIFS